MIRFYKKSSARLRYRVEGLDSGVSVTQGRFAIKPTPASPDTEGLVVPSASIQSGAGYSDVDFAISPSQLDGLQEGLYVCGVKVQLSTNDVIMLDSSVEEAEVCPPFIEWTP